MRQRRVVADAICISIRRATRDYRTIEVQGREEQSAMFKQLFEATEELADIQARLPKDAGRRPKRSATAHCCLLVVCCGCCWMDDGSSSKAFKEKVKQRAMAATRKARAATEAASLRPLEGWRSSTGMANAPYHRSLSPSMGMGALAGDDGGRGESFLGRGSGAVGPHAGHSGALPAAVSAGDVRGGSSSRGREFAARGGSTGRM